MNPLTYSMSDLDKIETIEKMTHYWRLCVQEVEKNDVNPQRAAFQIVHSLGTGRSHEWYDDSRYPEYAIITENAIDLERNFDNIPEDRLIKSIAWANITENLTALEEKLKAENKH